MRIQRKLINSKPPAADFCLRKIRVLVRLLILLVPAAFCSSSRADLQFDVFPGYDTAVREAGWFPMAFEIFNDGPSFNGVVSISSGAGMGSGQETRIPIELPNNTRKRVSISMFATGGRFLQWNVRLLDDGGKVRVEETTIQPKIIPRDGLLIGGLPRTFAGMPSLPDLQPNRPERKPHVARMMVEHFPDSPIALEGLDALYLNSERALSLNVRQVDALLAWLHGGGHLIVSVEQLGDVTSTPWLQKLLPATLKQMVNLPVTGAFDAWLKTTAPERSGNGFPGASARRSNRPDPFLNLRDDPALKTAEFAVARGTLKDGTPLIGSNDAPLILRANRGRGQITLLMFNPEREPFRSWNNGAWFWAKLIEIPGQWFLDENLQGSSGWSLDGVFGAMIDSRQIRKLPVQWLLLLLVIYLIVIGPFDQYVLKRIGRQMLTWITFPVYVVLFSLLIYFIGYKLRAGETEWNELHVVDILPQSREQAGLRGRSFVSIYSSSNAKYALGFNPNSEVLREQTHAAFRTELLDLYGGGRDAARTSIEHAGNQFSAEIFVPVWTSLLYVNDWVEPAPLPLRAEARHIHETWSLSIENLLDRALSDARVVIGGRVFELGILPPGEKKSYPIDLAKGVSLEGFVQQNGSQFRDAVQQRRNPLGDNQRGTIENPSLHSMVASFASLIPGQQPANRCVAPPGFDLTDLVRRGDAVIFAWDAGHSFIKPITQFTPPRIEKNTLLRLTIPVKVSEDI
jgi:hypothetical protein